MGTISLYIKQIQPNQGEEVPSESQVVSPRSFHCCFCISKASRCPSSILLEVSVALHLFRNIRCGQLRVASFSLLSTGHSSQAFVNVIIELIISVVWSLNREYINVYNQMLGNTKPRCRLRATVVCTFGRQQAHIVVTSKYFITSTMQQLRTHQWAA